MTIPSSYLGLLDTKVPTESVSLGGREWQLLSPEQLTQLTSVDRRETPAWQVLSSYANSFREVTGQSSTVDQNGEPYPLTRLENSVVIGDDDSGALLYFDLDDDNALYAYHPDGGDVTKLGVDFDQLLAVIETLAS